MRFSDSLKNIFWILLLLQIAPPLLQNLGKQYSKLLAPKTQVGLLKISGMLSDSTHYNKYLNKYFENNDIKAIVLKVDSPGGASGASSAIYNEIQALKKEYPKPVVVLVENMCASGAYYISCAADHIIAPPLATIGSVGVSLAFLFQLKNFINEHKVDHVSITAGKYKNATDPFTDMTPEQKAHLQDLTNDSYKQFTQDVAQARKLSLAKTDEWANGKLFTGRQALKMGLIDELGSAHRATQVVKEKALIEGDIEWVTVPQQTGLAQMFGGNLPDDEPSLATRFFNGMFAAFENKYTGGILK